MAGLLKKAGLVMSGHKARQVLVCVLAVVLVLSSPGIAGAFSANGTQAEGAAGAQGLPVVALDAGPQGEDTPPDDTPVPGTPAPVGGEGEETGQLPPEPSLPEQPEGGEPTGEEAPPVPGDEDETGEGEKDETGEAETAEETEEAEIEAAEEEAPPLVLAAEGLDIEVTITAADGVLPEDTQVAAAQLPVEKTGERVAPVAVANEEEALYQTLLTDEATVLDVAGGQLDEATAPMTMDSLEQMAEGEAGVNFSTMVAVPLDISLVCGEAEVQPEGVVTVSIGLPQGMAPESAAVYHTGANGENRRMDGRLEAGNILFETDHFSTYTVIGEVRTTAGTKLTNRSTGTVMGGGQVFYADANTTITAYSGENGLAVSGTSAANPAILYIHSGVTLTINGGGAVSGKPGGAGILLPDGETLYLRGNGTLKVTGGNGGYAGGGGNGGDGWMNTFKGLFGKKYGYWNGGTGGQGGTGGAGGGAGIGTNGALGGAGAASTRKPVADENLECETYNQRSGIGGGSGSGGGNSAKAGTLYVLDTVNVDAAGGASLTGDAGKAGKSKDDKGSGFENNYFSGGGGGGGAGGTGGAGAAIGSGGGGAGGGGAGGSGGMKCNTGSYGTASSYPSAGGGGGGAGATNGGNGSGTRYWTGGSGGSGGAAGTAGSGGSLYVAPTATCVNRGGAGINGRASATYTTDTSKNSFYYLTLDTAAAKPAKATAAVDAPTQSTVYLGVPFAEPLQASLAGWKFEGWYSAVSGGVQVISADGYFVAGAGRYTDGAGNWGYADDATLYSRFSPTSYTVNLDNQQAATAGTTVLYSKYDHGWYRNAACTTATSTITIPKKTGYNFVGYYTLPGGGEQVVDPSGKMLAEVAGAPGYNLFTRDTTLYARWEPTPYKVDITLTIDDGGAPYSAPQVSAVELYQYGLPKFALTEGAAGVYSSSDVISGRYDVYINGQSIDKTITVNNANLTAKFTFSTLAVATTLDGEAESMGPVTLRQNGHVRHTATRAGTGRYTVVLPSDDNTTYQVFVDGDDTGLTARSGGAEVQVAYYTATLKLTYPLAEWADAEVGLWQNGVLKHNLEYDEAASGAPTYVYSRAIQGDTDPGGTGDHYSIIINGRDSGKKLWLAADGFAQTPKTTLAEDSYYRVAVAVQKDGQPWAETTVQLYYAGQARYTLQYDEDAGQYVYDYVQKMEADGLEAKYPVYIFGSNTGAATGFEVDTQTAMPLEKEYFSVAYSIEGEPFLTQVVESGKTAPKPADPFSAGVSFGGWWTSTDGGANFDAEYTFTEPVNGPVELYARFAEPTALINGYRKCDASGDFAGDTHYRMVNLVVEGLPQTGTPVVSATLNVENGLVTELQNNYGYTVYNNVDPATGMGSVTVMFGTTGAGVEDAQRFLRECIVVEVKDKAAEHTMQIRLYGNTV